VEVKKNNNRKPAPDGRIYYSYADIHKTLEKMASEIEKFKPDLILAIGGGGYIPARILRSYLKVPILAISLELYNDATNTVSSEVKKLQWFDDTTEIARDMFKKKVLIVDEVDDTRVTLEYCVQEVIKTNKPVAIGVAVIHNKLKEKKGKFPDDVSYFVGENVPDKWNCYPWEAVTYGHDIETHEALAAKGRSG